MTLAALNEIDEEQAIPALLACCGSSEWAGALAKRRPFATVEQLHSAAAEIWRDLSREDWLEAFSKHPKIGDKSTAKWSAQEQRGIDTAGAELADRMRQLNIEYEDKFGYIFMICATGRTANEMLTALSGRLENPPDKELAIAAAEQEKIMHLRLDKLLSK